MTEEVPGWERDLNERLLDWVRRGVPDPPTDADDAEEDR